MDIGVPLKDLGSLDIEPLREIGRASCRERV